ncbi:MAG: hypothetical protein CPDRYMAC_6432 [uncultured Paraburkholderia sp.]|nr:MAG: hypothetical protein CPDRYDRY_6356 [uncultured Paraburkholderia sp.]CAH2944457.1 MAG: hypothetical protein CPDRYMAC_6432 [uncultured Paraburkholderia sp.]
MEGINDLGNARLTPPPIIAGYRQVVSALNKARIAVIGATVTPSLVPNGQVPANSPLAAAVGQAFAASYGSAQTDSYRKRSTASFCRATSSARPPISPRRRPIRAPARCTRNSCRTAKAAGAIICTKSRGLSGYGRDGGQRGVRVVEKWALIRHAKLGARTGSPVDESVDPLRSIDT